ncbi:hypothetical protein [Enterovibrio calviensis]
MKKTLIIFVIFFGVTACSSAPPPPPEPKGNPTAINPEKITLSDLEV